jgi:mono/diheme cytochrome c family protein
MRSAAFAVFVVLFVATRPASAQLAGKPIRPQVDPPKGPVRQILFKHCTSCHGIDDYAYNALDRAAWNALIDEKHQAQPVQIAGPDREQLLDWIVSRFGPSSRPFPRAYVPPEITTFFSDAEAEAVVARACTTCHGAERVNDARYSAERWRVVSLDMRQRGARLGDEELEKLVEWLGRVKGTNPNQ